MVKYEMEALWSPASWIIQGHYILSSIFEVFKITGLSWRAGHQFGGLLPLEENKVRYSLFITIIWQRKGAGGNINKFATNRILKFTKQTYLNSCPN